MTDETPTLAERLRNSPQYWLPAAAITALTHRITRVRAPWLRKPLIRWFIDAYRVNMAEAAEPDPEAYEHFNAFFTRALAKQPQDRFSSAREMLARGSVADASSLRASLADLDESALAVDAEHEQMIWTHPGMTTYYRNDAGRVVVASPWTYLEYWRRIHAFAPEDYAARELEPSPVS